MRREFIALIFSSVMGGALSFNEPIQISPASIQVFQEGNWSRDGKLLFYSEPGKFGGEFLSGDARPAPCVADGLSTLCTSVGMGFCVHLLWDLVPETKRDGVIWRHGTRVLMSPSVEPGTFVVIGEKYAGHVALFAEKGRPRCFKVWEQNASSEPKIVTRREICDWEAANYFTAPKP